jgi:SAM-dependent methyltransferase
MDVGGNVAEQPVRHASAVGPGRQRGPSEQDSMPITDPSESAGPHSAAEDDDDREPSTHTQILRRLYPEFSAGGYSRCDPLIEFYGRVHALLRPGMTVLDLGAGRGRLAHSGAAWRRTLVDLRGDGRTVVAVDPDPAVLTNKTAHQTLVMTEEHRIPVPDRSVDLVVANWVLEHVRDPGAAAAEIDRVLRPGGWFCGHTPNRNGYVALGNRIIPAPLHVSVLKRLQPDRQSRDVFAAFYRMNTTKRISELFPGYVHASYPYQGPPHYLGRRVWPYRVARVLLTALPHNMAATLMVFCRKPLDSSNGSPAPTSEP